MDSQSEVLFHEIFDVEKILVDWTTFFFLAQEFGRNSKKNTLYISLKIQYLEVKSSTFKEDAQSTQVENDIKKILMMSVIKYQNLSHDFETEVWSSWTQLWPLT